MGDGLIDEHEGESDDAKVSSKDSERLELAHDLRDLWTIRTHFDPSADLPESVGD